jgi:hypothetical protein
MNPIIQFETPSIVTPLNTLQYTVYIIVSKVVEQRRSVISDVFHQDVNCSYSPHE